MADDRRIRTDARPGARAFADALAALNAVTLRREIEVEQVRAPSRLAPHALALTADVLDPAAENDPDADELASGRFVLLHDPAEPGPWCGAWRVVSFARARLDPTVSEDPLLAEVGWAWLRESLENRGAQQVALAGTVTRVVDERFGELSGQPRTVDLEVRASWTPSGDARDVAAHLLAWGDLLGELAGLPALPVGVTALPGARW